MEETCHWTRTASYPTLDELLDNYFDEYPPYFELWIRKEGTELKLQWRQRLGPNNSKLCVRSADGVQANKVKMSLVCIEWVYIR